MTKPVLAVDIDDVLASLVPSVASFLNEAYPTTKLYQLSDFFSYEWDKVLGISVAEVQVRMQKYFESKYFEQLPTVPGAFRALTQLYSVYSIHCVTSRQLFLELPTRQWLSQHFDKLIDSIHFGNHYGIGPSRKKIEICKEINAVAIIDDIVPTCVECASSGVKSIIFNYCLSYPWSTYTEDESKSSATNSDLHVATSWEEVVKLLM